MNKTQGESMAVKNSTNVADSIIEHKDGIIIFDPKAELYYATHEHRKAIGQEVLVFDPSDRTRLNNCNINVLDFLPEDPEQKVKAIQKISEIICPQSASDNSTSRHFIDSARTCIEWAMEFLYFNERPKEERNLSKVYELLTQSPEDFHLCVKTRCIGTAKDSIKNLSINKRAVALASTILSMGKEEFSGVMHTARHCLKFATFPKKQHLTVTTNTLSNDKIDLFLLIGNDDGTPDKFVKLITEFVLPKAPKNKLMDEDQIEGNNLKPSVFARSCLKPDMTKH